jgi:Family of unknown function (DUF5683)
MRISFIILLLLSLALTLQVKAQDTTVVVNLATDSVRIDTSVSPRVDTQGAVVGRQFHPFRFLKKNYPAPRTALLLSAVVPGAGQVYNKRYWKVPLVYGAFVGGYLYYDHNRSLYKRLRTEYIYRADKDPATVPEPALTNLNDQSVLRYRDLFRGKSEQAGLIIVVTYLLTAAEAYTDAHLKSFDVSDDLSLRLGPSAQSGGLGFGVMVVYR